MALMHTEMAEEKQAHMRDASRITVLVRCCFDFYVIAWLIVVGVLRRKKPSHYVSDCRPKCDAPLSGSTQHARSAVSLKRPHSALSVSLSRACTSDVLMLCGLQNARGAGAAAATPVVGAATRAAEDDRCTPSTGCRGTITDRF